MSVTIVSSKKEGLKATVIVQSDEFAKVASTDAKSKAIEEGAKHLGLCGISGSSGPYAVDEQGRELDAFKMAELATKKERIRYPNDFYLSQSLSL